MNEILYKGNKIDVYSNKLTREQLDLAKSKFSKYKIEKKYKSELDYFFGLIELQSLLNKESFEKCFEESRTELFDYWGNLSYQERNRLILLQTNNIKNNSRFFRFNDKPIWIAFFDELLNALYHSEIAILELPQYFKLYRQFSDRMIQVDHYGLKPFIDEFIPIINLVHNDNAIVFYYHLTRSLYYLDSKYKLIRYPLCKDNCQVQPLKEDLRQIAHSILLQDDSLIIETFINSSLINDKIRKMLEKYKDRIRKKIK
jgi:hypothetical protein